MREHVKEFHRTFGLPAPERPVVPDDDTIDLRVTLICEEVAEVMGALFNASDLDTRTLADMLRAQVYEMTDVMREDKPTRDMSPRLVDLAKELADLRYVTDGTAVVAGIPAEEVFEAVHRSNMSKLADCDQCDGTGKVYEPCSCYECEYDDRHGGLIPCSNCSGSGKVPIRREDGKILKGPDYAPAEDAIRKLLDPEFRRGAAYGENSGR